MSDRKNEEPASERLRFAALVTTAFVLLTGPRLALHELWRDEAWLWLVARQSRSLSELFVPLARSGQGNLFPLLCYLARQVSASPHALQALHLLLAGAAAFVFARWAPFPRKVRLLFLLGYFPFYEYAVISRHYVAGALLLWLACVAARSRRPALGLGVALGLLCQTTVYGFVLAFAFAAAFAWERHRVRRSQAGPPVPIPLREGTVGLALLLAGAVAGALQLRPLPGTSFSPEWHFGWEPERAAGILALPWRAFVPLPQLQLHFWNSNLLDAWPPLQTAGGVAALAFAAALLWHRRSALLLFFLGSAGFLAFAYVKYAGVLRHQGHWWLLLFAALWLARGEAPEETGGESSPPFRERALSALLLALVFAHAGAALYASWMDLRHPFSNGAATATLLRKEGLDRQPLLGFREPPVSSVSLPLGRPLWAPSRGVYATHPDWGPTQRELGEGELRCAARAFARREGRDVVLVLNREITPWGEVAPAGATLGAIVATEDYHLYVLRLARLAETARDAGCGDAR